MKKKVRTQPVGFEPTLPEGIWFRVRRLNHSATAALRVSPVRILGVETTRCISRSIYIYPSLAVSHHASSFASYFRLISPPSWDDDHAWTIFEALPSICYFVIDTELYQCFRSISRSKFDYETLLWLVFRYYYRACQSKLYTSNMENTNEEKAKDKT